MKTIAKIKTDFPAKFGIPRQSGLIDELQGKIIFEPSYRNPDAIRGLESFSHIWLLWKFSTPDSENWSPTVRPPKLGGNTRVGVFASRSPFRPNSIGLSCVRLEKIEQTENNGAVLLVSGVDLMDGTEILDIKPYIPYADCHPEATSGFSKDGTAQLLNVEIPENLLATIPTDKRATLIKVLELDPRPAYQEDSGRIYGFVFAGFEIKFSVNRNNLIVKSISEI